jgi:hypothetical protein
MYRRKKMKGKMNSKWEGPFLVAEMPRPEACRLRTLDGVDDPYSWNKETTKALCIGKM